MWFFPNLLKFTIKFAGSGSKFSQVSGTLSESMKYIALASGYQEFQQNLHFKFTNLDLGHTAFQFAACTDVGWHYQDLYLLEHNIL